MNLRNGIISFKRNTIIVLVHAVNTTTPNCNSVTQSDHTSIYKHILMSKQMQLQKHEEEKASTKNLL